MAGSWVLAEFKDEAALCAAARRLRELGHTRIDAHSPVPLHGIDEALGLKRSVVALLAAGGCEALDPMISQQKVKPYRESDFWPDRISMRPPQPGTVAREDALTSPLVTGRGPDGKVLAALPIPVTRALLETGRKRFEIICAACHGYLGDGVSLVARNMSLRPPPSLLARAQQPDGWYFQVMSEGSFSCRPATCSPSGPK